MEQEVPKRRYRLILDFKCQFPEKLFDVANDGYLIYWNRDESVSVKDEDEFEQNVMRLYPGFLQNPSILNLKRLFREYGFERDLGPNGILKFSHPSFQRMRRELLVEIKTRRKSFQTPVSYWKRDESDSDSVVFPTEDGRRYSTRKRRRTARYSANVDNKVDSGASGDFIEKHPATFHIKKPDIGSNIPFDDKSKCNSDVKEVIKPDLDRMMESFASNEFNEQEYIEWLAKQRKMDEAKSKVTYHVKSPEKSKDFWWMYDEKPSMNEEKTNMNENNSRTVSDQESCMPCGFCKCCSAISNYVHIFGEVPENIQVYDIVEEIYDIDESSSVEPDNQHV